MFVKFSFCQEPDRAFPGTKVTELEVCRELPQTWCMSVLFLEILEANFWSNIFFQKIDPILTEKKILGQKIGQIESLSPNFGYLGKFFIGFTA